MTSFIFSVHLSTLLGTQDIAAIKVYLEREQNMGIFNVDRHFTIRKSNGLVSFDRIDIYVSSSGIIFLSSIGESRINT